MKRKIIGLLAIVLCFSFCLVGCNLVPEDNVSKASQVVAETENGTSLTREELIKGYNSYFSTFLSNNSNNVDAAMTDLIEYLLTKKIYVAEAESLITQNEIELTTAEINNIWDKTFSTIESYLETFESQIKNDLNITEEDEEKDKDENYYYTPYEKTVEVVLNSETGKYEIKRVKTIMVCYTDDDGEKVFEYVSEEKKNELQIAGKLIAQTTELNASDFTYEKLYEGVDVSTLTDDQKQEKEIAIEAYRRYIQTLKNNEEGKGLSTDNASIFEREINRVYTLLYENVLINKLYNYKANDIIENNITEDDVLGYYLNKVKETYERYTLDTDAFKEEIVTGVSKAKPYGSYYSTGTKWQEDVYYIPEDCGEDFLYVAHIVVNLSDEKVQQINDLKKRCTESGESDAYFEEELAKIINIENLKLNERDKEGYVVVKNTDAEAITFKKMVKNLNDEMSAIDTKYSISTPADISSLSEEDYYKYIYERADLFNEYSYKYSIDEGTLQIQSTYISGQTNENWYNYAIGLGDTDRGFAEAFIQEAKDLYNSGTGFVSAVSDNAIYLSGWADSDNDGIDTSTISGYSAMMYCGKVTNLFDCFNYKFVDADSDGENDNPFTNAEFFAMTTENMIEAFRAVEENGKAENYSLKVLDYYRLGLTGNKTMFDLIYEQIFEDAYSKMTTKLEEDTIKNANVKYYTNLYRDLLA